MPTWDTEQYLKFKDERTQPTFDLISRIQINDPKNIVDVGCGPGNSTSVIKQRWPAANIDGFDSSEEMLEIASKSNSNINWFQEDVANWESNTQYDIIYSSAVLQWVPNHKKLIPKLMGFINKGGALAVQLPAHYESPLHQLLLDVARLPKWEVATKNACDLLSLKPPSFYYDLLAPLSSKAEMWETIYIHIMDSAQAIVEWFEGTGIRPFMECLPNPDDRNEFKMELLKRYERVYNQQQNGKVLFPFRRFFFIAYI